jgi:hypothetical protein
MNRPRGGRPSPQISRFRGRHQLSSMVRVVENRNDGGSITTGVGTITARTDVVQEVESPSSLMSSHGFDSPSPEQLAQRRDMTSTPHDPLDEFEYPFIVTRRTDVIPEVESPSSLMSSHGLESPSPEQLARRRNATIAQLDPLDEFGLSSSSLPFRPRPLLVSRGTRPLTVEELESPTLVTRMARAEVLVAEVHEELARVSVRVAEIREELTRIATERAEYLARAEVLARDAVVLSSNRDLARVLETLDVFASRSSTFREVGWQSMMSRARNAATDTDEFDSLVEQLLDMGFDMERIARTIFDLCVSGATFLDTNLVIHSMITDELSHSEDDVLFGIRDAVGSDDSDEDDDDDDDDGDRYWVSHIAVDVAVAEARPPDDFICAICLDTPTRMSDVASIIGCTHKFCYDCINTWAERSNKCPCCNMRFHTIERSCT